MTAFNVLPLLTRLLPGDPGRLQQHSRASFIDIYLRLNPHTIISSFSIHHHRRSLSNLNTDSTQLIKMSEICIYIFTTIFTPIST